MADPPKSKAPSKKGKIALYSILAVAGVGGAYYLYKRYEANAGASTSTAAAPADTTPASSVPATTAPITTLAEWKTAILAAMASIPGGENVAATGLADALSGHCVGPNEYAALNSALASVGQPPGTGILTIKQCAASTPGSGGGAAAGGGVSGTHGAGSTAVAHPPKRTTAPRPTAAATKRANNAAAAARRKANDLAAAARRRAQNLAASRRPPTRRPTVVAPQVKRATGVK